MKFGEAVPIFHAPSAVTDPVRAEINLDALRDEILLSGELMTSSGVNALNQRIMAHNQARANRLCAKGQIALFEPLSLTNEHGYQSLCVTACGDPDSYGRGGFSVGRGWNRPRTAIHPDGIVSELFQKTGERQFCIVESLVFTPKEANVIVGTQQGYRSGFHRATPVIEPRLGGRPLVDPYAREPLIDVALRYEPPGSLVGSRLSYRDKDPRGGRFVWSMLLKTSVAEQLLRAVQQDQTFIHQVTEDLIYNLITIEKSPKLTLGDWERGERQDGHPIRPPFAERVASGIPLHVFDGFTEGRTPIASYHDQLTQRFPRLTIQANDFDKTYAYIAVGGR